MNNIAMAQAVQRKVRPRFRGRKTLISKVPCHYPHNLEREYIRITNTYMTLLLDTVREHIIPLRKAMNLVWEAQIIFSRLRLDDMFEFGASSGDIDNCFL